MKNTDLLHGNRIHFFAVAFLGCLALFIFYPIFFAEYAYTDEIVQLWFYPRNSGYQMFLPQGRYITEKLFHWLFGSLNTIREISIPRIFSLCTGLLAIPTWYYVMHRVAQREKLPAMLPFFATLYFICTPQFSIYVSWASCLELFIANTSGLLSGYFLYAAIRDRIGRIGTMTGFILSICFGIVSLFTYQNGFGCFLIPFFIYLIVNPHQYKLLVYAVGIYFFIYVVYYLLFRLNLQVNDVAPNSRTQVNINPVNKIKFMYSRPLSSAFHFTYLFNEKSVAGYVVYMLMLMSWAAHTFFRLRRLTIAKRVLHCMTILIFFALMYIPSLIIKENYSSNRTLLALKMAVFFLVMESLIHAIQNTRHRRIFVAVVSVMFVVNAFFNFNRQFLAPVTHEYKALRSYIEASYKPGVSEYHFIRPTEDFFERKYGITRSWDEFGVPSSFFDWVPEFLVRQVIYEKTGDRQLAQSLVVRHWLGRAAYVQSGEALPQTGILVDAEEIIK